jgi:hypothetical protein
VLRDAELPKVEAVEEKPRKQTDFEKRLGEFLGKTGKSEVNEEELFAAVASERVRSLKGKGASKRFDSIMNDTIKGSQGGDINYETLTKFSLNQLVGAGKISHDDANIIYSQAFAAAQLDFNENALYGERGNARAVADVSSAIAKAQSVVEEIKSKQRDLLIRDRFEPEAAEQQSSARRGGGVGFDGAGGFLFKPFSDIDGNMLVLAPKELNGWIDRVEIKDRSGRILDTARSRGVGYSGREYIRFNKSGSEYPREITVDIVLNSGGVRSYYIPDSSLEWD